MKQGKLFLVLCLFLMGSRYKTKIPNDGFCGITNTTTQDKEEISYTVFYSLAGMYVHAGDATFTNHLEKINGKWIYHAIGKGQSNSNYDWIYKVRDVYETWMDAETMQPLRFRRDVLEGKTRKFEQVLFNRSNNTIQSDSTTIKSSPCIQDVLSAVYYSRNLDFSLYKKNDTIPFTMFLENEIHPLHIRYLGKEEVKTKFGKFHAIKFKPLLVEGTIFESGENMTVWVSDDEARVPVRIESHILIGSIKVDMTAVKNLRHPLISLIRKP
jgi:hypothetical protein